jgi:hypothetical protein
VRPRHALVIAGMLLRFFTRKVLRLGVLRSKAVRVLALVAILLVGAAGVGGGYVFFKPMLADERAWGLLFDIATVSVVLWAMMAFLLVKVLFLSADGLLDLSFQLPVTNRERSFAFLLYEVTMATVVSAAGFASLIGSALLLRGPEVLPSLFQSIFAPMLLTYGALTVAHLALSRLLVAVRLGRLRGVVLVLVVFGLLLAYSSRLVPLSAQVSDDYLDGRTSWVWVTSLSWLSRTHGGWVTTLAVVAALVVLAALAVALTPNEHVRHSRFVTVPTGRRLGALLSPYDLCLLRSTQTWLGLAVTVALYAFLLLSGLASPLWALTLLSIGGLYQFAATAPLRLMTAYREPPGRVYTLLLRGQLGLVAAVAAPALLLLWVLSPDGLPNAPLALAGAAGGAVVAISIGVVFPAENDNPFSVFIGLAVTAAVLGIIGISLGVLQAPPTVLGATVVAALALLVWYSVQGIRIDESRRRHEEVTAGGQHDRGGRRAHGGHGRCHPAVPHAVDR